MSVCIFLHIDTDIILIGDAVQAYQCLVLAEMNGCQVKKCTFLYSAVSSPQDCSKHFYTLLPGKPVESNTISTSLGSIQPYATITVQRLLKGCSYTYPPLSVARYSFIQLEQYRVKKLAQGFNMADQDSNPGSLSRESEALPLSHCALVEIES